MTSLSPANAERLKLAFQECRDMEGPLNEQLQTYAAAGREYFPAYGEAVDRLVARIHENGGGENAPRPGDPMPPFILPDETGRLISLNSLLEKGPVAVMFYRGHWCPYCRLNVRAVMVDAPKNPVPVGTVAGVQLPAVLKSELPGVVDQVASCARAGIAASNATAAVVVSKCARIAPPPVRNAQWAIRPRSPKPRRDWRARRSRIIAVCPHQAKTPHACLKTQAQIGPRTNLWSKFDACS